MKRVLFVDDESLVLEIIERKMRKTDIKCYFANSAEEAIEILKNNEIDVMVSDLQMPVTNGLDLSIRATEISPRTVRIVLSGNSRANSIIDAINEGHIYKYIVKPWDIDDDAIEMIQNAVKVSKKWASKVTEKIYIDVEDLWKFKGLEGWVLVDAEGKVIKSNSIRVLDESEYNFERKVKSSIGELRLIDMKV